MSCKYVCRYRLQEEAEMNRRDQRDAIVYKDTKMKLVEHHKGNVIGKVHYLVGFTFVNIF